MKIILQDITQVYIQPKIEINCIVIYHLSVQLKKRYSKNIILFIIKLIYDLAKARNYWFAIYLNHHKEKLGMAMLLYDIYLFITKDGGRNFGIARFQMDNIFNAGMETFMKKEETEIIEVKFKAKT